MAYSSCINWIVQWYHYCLRNNRPGLTNSVSGVLVGSTTGTRRIFTRTDNMKLVKCYYASQPNKRGYICENYRWVETKHPKWPRSILLAQQHQLKLLSKLEIPRLQHSGNNSDHYKYHEPTWPTIPTTSITETNELIQATATVIPEAIIYKIKDAYRRSPCGEGWKPQSGKSWRMFVGLLKCRRVCKFICFDLASERQYTIIK